MASFTDQIPQFNPYIQQLPVDAMVKVGMEKQRRYDEGVQKIQTQIDNVAGMDIAKDSHKQYLQSKLNELGSKLKTVAAGDFSNYQLVNSVSGMTTQIIKDPVIQNAVYSTQLIRKGQEELETAKKEGKSSVQNEEYWNKQIADWNANPDLKARFSGSYVPYTDVDKKLRDIAEKIHEVDSSVDVPYQRDNQGNTLYFKTDPKTGQTTASTDPNSGGVAKIDDAMLRTKIKGKPAEKILANFMSSLNENDQRQLKIDSWYHYKGVTKDMLKADLSRNFNNAKYMAFQEVVNLNVELTTNTRLTPAQKSELQARINNLQNQERNKTLDTQYADQVAQLDRATDIENYKYNIYTQKYLTGLAKSMAYESKQQEYVSNPYAQMDMERKRLQFQYDNANREQRNWEAKFAWEKEAKTQELALGYAKLSAEGKAKGGSESIVLPGRISTEVARPSIEKLQGEIDSITGVHKPGEPEVFGAIDKLNAKYAQVLPATRSMETSEQKKAYLDEMARKASMDPSFIDKQTGAELKEYLKQRRAYDIMAAQKQQLYDEAVKNSSKFNADIDKIFKSEDDVTLSNGKKIKAKDLFGFASNIPYTAAEELDETKLMAAYRGTSLEPLAVATIKGYRGKPLTSDERLLYSKHSQIRNKYSSDVSTIVAKKLQVESDYLATRMPELQTQVGTLSPNNKVDMDVVDRIIGAKQHEYNQLGLDVDKNKQYDADAIMKLRTDKKKEVAYTVEKNYDGSGTLHVESGTTTYQIPMTAQEFGNYFPQYSRRNPVSEIKYNVLASPYKSTNVAGVTDGSSAVNAGLSGYDIPQLARTSIAPIVRMDVNGSAFNDGSGNDKYQVILYVNDNGHWIAETLNPDYVNDAGLQSIISNIGTNTVDEILKKHKKD